MVYADGLFVYLLKGPEYFYLFLNGLSSLQKFLFWSGALTAIYLWSRIIRENKQFQKYYVKLKSTFQQPYTVFFISVIVD